MSKLLTKSELKFVFKIGILFVLVLLASSLKHDCHINILDQITINKDD